MKVGKIVVYLLIYTLLCTISAFGFDTNSIGNLNGESDLLQFTTGKQILGFKRSGMYVAAQDHALKISFVGAKEVKPVEIVSPVFASFASTSAKPLEAVKYQNLWDGVTLIYERTGESAVKSTYYVEPVVTDYENGIEASVRNIRLRYNVPVSVDSGGNLLFAFQSGQMQESAPVAWQEKAGKRIPVTVDYFTYNEFEVGFTIGTYDPQLPLVIDPTLSWNTFMGSALVNLANSLTVDGSGNIYVAGKSNATWGAPIVPFSNGYDAFVAKYDNDGTLLWNTFMGSATDDNAASIAVDGDGNVYVTGNSDATWGAPINPYVGGKDIFVAKLDTNGALQWSTFSGNVGDDEGKGIGVDGDGNIYLTGVSSATWGAPVIAYSGGTDAFSAKLNNAGVLQWNTFMGSATNDSGNSLTVDGSGNVFITGNSDATWGAPGNPFAGGGDAFVVKLDTDGALQWSTFIGSAILDEGNALTVNGSGNIYVIGVSNATWGAPVNAHPGGSDAFVVKLNSSGVVQWNTFLGSASSDVGYSIAVKGDRNIYVAGISDATWGAPVNPYVGNLEVFTAKLNINGVLHWN